MLLALLAGPALAGSAPHYSLPKLVTANGYGAMVFSSDRLSDGYEHLYQQYDATSDTTPDLLYDTYFGVTDAGVGGWLTATGTAEYEPGTGIIRVSRPTAAMAGGLSSLNITEYDFAPMSFPGVGFAQVLQVRNTGTTTISAAQLVSLHNWKMNGVTGGDEIVASLSATQVDESGNDGDLAYTTLDSTDVSCASVYDAVNAGQQIGGGCNTSGSDVAPAFGWKIGDLAPGAEVWVGVVTSASPSDAISWISGRGAEQWYLDELSDWSAWQANNVVPADLSDTEAAVYAQQLAFLREAQVQEPGGAFGQIPASLPVSASTGELDHIWNITWVRDGSYAAAALASAGRTDEAANVLRFLGQGKTGAFRAYVGDADYLVSVCRTYGDGSEWSDTDSTGPNVEYDDFGLYLWALGTIQHGGRDDVVAELGPNALDGVADVLVGLIDPNSGLLLPDSSIWERHWDGNQQQFAYSSIQAVAGLSAAAKIADALGDPRGDTYRSAAATITTAVSAHLLSAGGVIGASAEQVQSGDGYLDLAAVEAFNHGVLDARGPELAASYDAWDRTLKVASGNGYARNDDGSTYDNAEWPVVDLRLAEALRRSCDSRNVAASDGLFGWVTGQAALNHNTIAELYDPSDANYAGPAPMLGFGAGAYVWGLNQRAGIDAACAADTGAGPGTEGCGCVSAASGDLSGFALLLGGLLAARRRRGDR